MKYKNIVLAYMVFSIGPLILFFAALYLYDPLQIFHTPIGRESTFQSNMRLQSAGIINNYDFDAVILGSSLLANTSGDEASKLLGNTYVNLSIDGSSFFERRIFLDYLLKNKKGIKAIIYSFDAVFLLQIKERDDLPMEDFVYLYDGWKSNDIKAYLNKKYINCLFTLSASQQCIGLDAPFTTPSAWYAKEEHRVRFGGIENWVKNKQHKQIKGSFDQIRHATTKIDPKRVPVKEIVDAKILQAKKYVDDYFLNFVEKSNSIDFIVVFPPYSRIKYAILAQTQKDEYEIHKAVLRYMSEKDDELSNLKVYAFGDELFVDDVATYKDLSHYGPKINTWMLESIQSDHGRLNAKRIDRYIQTIDSRNYGFDLIALQKEIERLMP